VKESCGAIRVRQRDGCESLDPPVHKTLLDPGYSGGVEDPHDARFFRRTEEEEPSTDNHVGAGDQGGCRQGTSVPQSSGGGMRYLKGAYRSSWKEEMGPLIPLGRGEKIIDGKP